MATTREFRLLTDLCRRAFAGGEVEHPETVDWALFLKLARMHRVEGLVAKGMTAAMPAWVAAEIRRNAIGIAAVNLRSATESLRLAQAFRDAEVSLLFVKGVTLGALAYSDLATKSAIDIDLLIAPEDVARAGRVLTDCGWRPVIPGSVERLDWWHRARKESVWTHPELGLQADLHNHLTDTKRLIPSIDVRSPSQLVEVAPGIALRTLAQAELYAYLAVHGAWGAWFRLKWITDAAALLASSTATQIEQFHDRAGELGAGRASAQALLLADSVYGTLDVNPGLRSDLLANPVNRRLLRISRDYLERSTEPTERRFGTIPIYVSHLLLIPGAAAKIGEIVRQARQTFYDRRA